MPAVASIMLLKAAGVPIPIPADVLMLATAAAATQGKVSLWQAFLLLLAALLIGGWVQYSLAGGPGRTFLYRYGPTLGLTAARLDAASAGVRRGGIPGIALAILTPGVRAATVAACGLAGLPLRLFLPGLLIGSGLFLGLHFGLGYLGAVLLSRVSARVLWPVAAVFLIAGLGAWLVIRRRQRPAAPRAELLAEAVEAWHEATCPACLLLGSALPAARVEPRRAEAA